MSHPSTRAGTPQPLEGSTLFAADDPLYDCDTDIEAQAIDANLHSHDSGHGNGSASGSGSGSYSVPGGSSSSLPSGSPPSYRNSTSTMQWLRSKLPGGHVPTDARYLEGEQGLEIMTWSGERMAPGAISQPSAMRLSVMDKMLALAANAATEAERKIGSRGRRMIGC